METTLTELLDKALHLDYLDQQTYKDCMDYIDESKKITPSTFRLIKLETRIRHALLSPSNQTPKHVTFYRLIWAPLRPSFR